MTTFYTYVHTRNDSGAIFYVGKGKEKRSHSKLGRNKHWHRVVNKHGYAVEILEYFEDENDAFAHERYLIESLSACGIFLCNITAGGRGGYIPGSGRPPGPPTVLVRLRLSEAHYAAWLELGTDEWLHRTLIEKAVACAAESGCQANTLNVALQPYGLSSDLLSISVQRDKA